MENTLTFEDFAVATAQAQSDEQLFSALTTAVGAYGYDKILFSVFNEPLLPAFTHRTGIFQHNMAGWDAFYAQDNYAGIDPVARLIKSGAPAFAWEALPELCSLSLAQEGFMSALADFGLHHGVAIPVGNNTAVFGLATGRRNPSPRANLDILSAICNQAYRTFKRLHQRAPDTFKPAAQLTVVEREVLQWIRAGKTNHETCRIMGISVKTVDTHMRSVFRKLEAPNRVSAVIKAIHWGYLTL